jgi:hypothetical protein
MRWLLVAGVAVAWLAAAGPAPAGDRVVDRGIVQSVTPSAVVLRALDGTELEVPVGPRTRVRLNGRPATLADVAPGLVAETVQLGSAPAVRVRLFGHVPRAIESGRVVRVSRSLLVLRLGGSGRARIALTDTTVVRRAGRLLDLRALRPGMRVVVARQADGSARLVRVTGRGA